MAMFREVPETVQSIRIGAPTRDLFARALGALTQGSIEVVPFDSGDSGFAGSGGASKILQDYAKIWLPRNATDIDYTLSHELAHIVVSAEQDTLRMDPSRPGQPHRQILGLILSWIEHAPAHDLMGEYGFDVGPEVHARSVSFRDEVAAMGNGFRNTVHTGFAIGLADKRIQANGAEGAILDEAAEILQRKSPPTRAKADAFSAIVTRERIAARDWAGMWAEIVRAFPIGPEFSSCVYTRAAFRQRFGY